MESFTGLNDFLAWLTGITGGSFIVVGWFASWLFEGTAWWQALSSKAKSLIIVGVSAVLGVGATVLAQFPSAVAAIEPYFRAVLYVVLAWLATQTAHRLDNMRK